MNNCKEFIVEGFSSVEQAKGVLLLLSSLGYRHASGDIGNNGYLSHRVYELGAVVKKRPVKSLLFNPVHLPERPILSPSAPDFIEQIVKWDAAPYREVVVEEYVVGGINQLKVTGVDGEYYTVSMEAAKAIANFLKD